MCIRSIDRLNKIRYQRMKLNIERIFHDTNIMGKKEEFKRKILKNITFEKIRILLVVTRCASY